MNTAKQAVHDIKAKAGHHDTTVHEEIAPAVSHETVKPTRHEEINTAVEQEVHQDHYHRTVQPVKDTEVLPEQHKYRVAGTERREFDHRNNKATERALKAEAGKLHNERVVAETTQTQSRAPAVQGEHFHHHVHETVQPLIQKEVIQPEVVHTTVPVHEVHHHAASHHPTTQLPAVSMHEFKQQQYGGATGLSGERVERDSAYEGCPEGMRGEAGQQQHGLRRQVGGENVVGGGGIGGAERAQHSTSSSTAKSSMLEGFEGGERGVRKNVGGHTGAGVGGANVGAPAAPASSAAVGGGGIRNTRSSGTTSGNAAAATAAATAASRAEGARGGVGHAHESHGQTHTGKKPSLMDKLNPFKDADGDGKSGIMD